MYIIDLRYNSQCCMRKKCMQHCLLPACWHLKTPKGVHGDSMGGVGTIKIRHITAPDHCQCHHYFLFHWIKFSTYMCYVTYEKRAPKPYSTLLHTRLKAVARQVAGSAMLALHYPYERVMVKVLSGRSHALHGYIEPNFCSLPPFCSII